MKFRLVTLALIVALLVTVFAPFAPAPAAEAAPSYPVTGTFTDALGGIGTFAGSFTPTRFAVQGGQLVAIGTLTGTLTDSLGTILGTVTRNITLPVTSISGSCQILNLVLGPLDLDLLGLQVHLNQVVLNITAQSGAGNLLGNLLCAVAHLLDSNGALTSISRLLNQILGQL